MGKLAKVYEVSDCRSVNEVLNKSGTAWEPTSAPITATKLSPVDSNFHAIVRPDTHEMLGVCTKRYKPNSHVVHLARLDNMVRNGDLLPERVSIWDAGRLMAFQFRAPILDAEILDGDRISPLLTMAFFNDGKHGDMSFFADFRWACTNQMGRVAAANQGKDRAAHRGDVHAEYERILMERIQEMRTHTERYDAMRRMANVQLMGKPLLGYFAQAMALPEPERVVEELYDGPNREDLPAGSKTLKAVLEAYREDSTLPEEPTVWRAYNGVTRYLTHKAGRSVGKRMVNALIDGRGPERAFQEAAKIAA